MMIGSLSSTINSVTSSLLQESQSSTAASSQEDEGADEVETDGATETAAANDPENAVAVATNSNTQSSLSVAGGQAVESSEKSSGAAASANRAEPATSTARSAELEAEDEAIDDIARSRAEAIAAQNRDRRNAVVESIAQTPTSVPEISKVEAKPSSQEAATRYAAANESTAPARATAELRA
ncbi:MAG: hypothetical protein ACU0B9_18045 [Limimaricola soesokkakensis]|uniref:hypothetical protein n=1 Tax=Limimaricola soesokkakensis TaxID=1343159 RepID=UPI00405A0B37